MNKPGNVGAPKPVNTLFNKSNTSSRTPLGIPSSSSRVIHSSPPPAKRQKLSEIRSSPAHSQATFVLHDKPSETPIVRKRSIGSVSLTNSQRSISSNNGTSQRKLTEYRNLDYYTNYKHKRPRPRRHSSVIPSQDERVENPDGESIDQLKIDEDNSEDDDVDLVNPQKAIIGSQQVQREPSLRRPIGHYSAYFAKGKPTSLPRPKEMFEAVVDSVERQKKSPKVHSSPDELAFSKDEIAAKRPAKRRKELSPSLSKRGNILPTVFTGASVAKPPLTINQEEVERVKSDVDMIIGKGLRILRGTSGQCLYRADHAGDPEHCFLSVREISSILHPVDHDKELLKSYAYLTVSISNVKNVIRCREPEKSRIVIVNRISVDLSVSAGSKLMVEFASLGECYKFFEWVARHNKANRTQITIKDCPVDKLEREFNSMEERAKRHRVITDDDTGVQIGDDIKLIQHNQNNGIRAFQRDTCSVTESGTRSKMKDQMVSSFVPRPSRNDIVSMHAEDIGRRLPQRQPRTTRSTFALIDSPEPQDPEPEAWTSINPGWEKHWRNSLVFPATGKNRAIVDKDDIQRLDEGQFLNDNIIIFYLRYLQQKLEDGDPKLAQRIYFHNTFFYDKLKPTKTGLGINYDSVKAWTSKVDLFSKDYIIVPINEYTHWYVAIICNAPKLVASSDTHDKANDTAKTVIPISDDTEVVQETSQASPQKGKLNGYINGDSLASAAQEDVVENLRRMSIDSSSHLSIETKQTTEDKTSLEGGWKPNENGHEVQLIKDSDGLEAEVEQVPPPADSQTRKKAGKRQSIGSRRYNPDQPRIITLDSLGGSHSPTCSYLKQYLVAELRDKKGIEIAVPGAMGMTAKDVPEQTNHCDCGLFLLGYIQEFLRNPDIFVKSLLQRDGNISWSLSPSSLRNDIRQLIFKLQKEQQQKEDVEKQKRQARKTKFHTKTETETSGYTTAPVENPTIDLSTADMVNKNHRIEEAVESELPPTLTSSRPCSSRGNNTAFGEAVDLTHGVSYEIEAKSAVGESQPSGSSNHDGVPKPRGLADLGHYANAKENRVRSIMEPRVAVSPRRIGQVSNHEGLPQIPGSYPVSPIKAQRAKHRSASPETEGSSNIQNNFVPHITSQTPSSKSSRGGTPLDPVVVDGLDNHRRDKVQHNRQRSRDSQQARQIVVEIPSSNVHSSPLGPGDKTVVRRETETQSAHFPDRSSGERLTAARLRQTRNHVIDLSED
ncbi:hypothetical protein F5Y19DRAFT_55132 [Xylariaceae sp. FL1651]|nr:hypothetical protein F5Y19DRAFT_55132 [Xylariaceae sp. FL1651]